MTIVCATILVFLYCIISIPIGIVQLNAHVQQVNLPHGTCFFNETTWMVDNGGLTSTMYNDATVFIYGQMIPIRAEYPAPPYALNVKKPSEVSQKQAAWQNARVSCYVDLIKGKAYPEPLLLELALGVLLLPCLIVFFVTCIFISITVSRWFH